MNLKYLPAELLGKATDMDKSACPFRERRPEQIRNRGIAKRVILSQKMQVSNILNQLKTYLCVRVAMQAQQTVPSVALLNGLVQTLVVQQIWESHQVVLKIIVNVSKFFQKTTINSA
jgi:hypothetical protein